MLVTGNGEVSRVHKHSIPFEETVVYKSFSKKKRKKKKKRQNCLGGGSSPRSF